MVCPSCNQLAASFLRYSFSLQGVPFSRSIQGYLKCQNCGTLLRVTRFKSQFWILVIATLALLIVFSALSGYLFSKIGAIATTAVWIILILLTTFAFTFGLWKFARVELGEPGTQAEERR